uniref:Uncharacterized protein n=1 Tax=Anguilla anguilla TaxID=7936 RepID=A0A0E9XPZ1_ANGAN
MLCPKPTLDLNLQSCVTQFIIHCITTVHVLYCVKGLKYFKI